MLKNHEMEDKALRLSIVVLIIFALAGIVFGLLLSSDVVFFDGVFSLLSVIISFITLKISRFIHKQDHFNFPFGKENIEPVVVIFQYLILSGFLIYALYDAVLIILSGESEVELGGVIIYLLFTTSLLAWYVKKLKKNVEKFLFSFTNIRACTMEDQLKTKCFYFDKLSCFNYYSLFCL